MKDISAGFIWAHRGRNRIAPENTMAAFTSAITAGDKGIELDVTLSSDGIPVVIHDDRVDRTTNGTGNVFELSIAELRDLDAGSWFDKRFKGERLPLLSEVLNEARGEILVNIEIKTSAWRDRIDEGIEIPVLTIVKESGMTESVLISSFDWRSLQRFYSLDSGIPLGILTDTGWDLGKAAAFAADINAYSIHPDIKDLKEGMPVFYRRFSGRIFPYTIMDAATGDRVIQAGADGIIADLPFGSAASLNTIKNILPETY